MRDPIGFFVFRIDAFCLENQMRDRRRTKECSKVLARENNKGEANFGPSSLTNHSIIVNKIEILIKSKYHDLFNEVNQ